MHTATASVHGHAAYRAASLRQVLAQRLQWRLRQVWQALEAQAARRAAPYLLHTAEHYESHRPDVAAELRRLADATH